MRRLFGLCVLLLTGCLGATPERAQIVNARMVRSAEHSALEVEQQLQLSPRMLEALASGIDLRLVYRIRGCAGQPAWETRPVIHLRYSALRRAYELQFDGGASRRYPRRSALLGALDRVRLTLPSGLPADCRGDVLVALDLVSLPTPLRFPAFFNASEWRLISPVQAWHDARD